MIPFAKGVIATAISLGVIVGNKDEIESFFDEIVEETRRITTAGDLRTISNMLDYHYIKKGRYPSEKQFPGWLLENSKENNMRSVLLDNWGNQFLYATTNNNRRFTLISMGKDGKLNSEDDMYITGP